MAVLDFLEPRRTPLDQAMDVLAPSTGTATTSYAQPRTSSYAPAPPTTVKFRTPGYQPSAPAPPPYQPPSQPPPSGTRTRTNPTQPTQPTAPGPNQYAPTLTTLYNQYFYRPPTSQELAIHTANLSRGGSLSDIQRELEREALRLGLKPPNLSPDYTRTAENQPTGVDSAKWLGGHTSPKYLWKQAQTMFDQRTPEGRAQTLAYVQQQAPQWFTDWTIDGDRLRYGGQNLHSDFDGYNAFDAWRGSKAGEWGSQWLPIERNGQAYDHFAASRAAQQAAGGAGGGSGAGGGTGQPGTAGAFGDGSDLLGGQTGMDFGITGPYGYDDPTTRMFEEFLRGRIDDLTDPINDPARDKYADLLASSIDQLMGAPYTDAEKAGMETRAFDQLEVERQQAIKNEIRRMAALGHDSTSGTITQAVREVNARYDKAKSARALDLLLDERDEKTSRRQEAIGLGGSLSGLSGQQRYERDARLDQAMQLVAMFPALDEKRMQLALQVLGMTNASGNPMDMVHALGNISAQAQHAAAQGRAESQNYWKQLGDLLADTMKDND